MFSTRWKVDTLKPILVVTDKTLNLSVDIATMEEGIFRPSDIILQRNGIGYYATYSFPDVGQYLLKIVEDTQLIPDVYLSIEVNAYDDGGDVLQGVSDILSDTNEIHAIHGLNKETPMTVTRTSRVAGEISQTLSGDATNTSTVTRD
jgi:hypothetical protein